MEDKGKLDRSVCMAVDVEGYSRRLESEQEAVQSALCRITTSAGTRASLAVDSWNVQKQGDGQLILAPLGNEARYVDDLTRQLAAEVDRYNRELVPEARLRLRLALHQGIAYPGSNGFIGDAAVLVCRLLDAEVCREALRRSNADLVVILSDSMYRDNILAERTSLRPGDFADVAVEEAKVSTRAWIWSPDPRAAESLREARSRKAVDGGNGHGNGRPSLTQHAKTINNIEKIQRIAKAHFGTSVRGEDDDD